jgi:hypothetical protein
MGCKSSGNKSPTGLTLYRGLAKLFIEQSKDHSKTGVYIGGCGLDLSFARSAVACIEMLAQRKSHPQVGYTALTFWIRLIASRDELEMWIVPI